MRVAVLSRGPSFNETWARVDPNGSGRLDIVASETYELIIGVNDIPTSIPCDWWVFRDWVSMDNWVANVRTIGKKGEGRFPGIFTGPHVLDDLILRRLFHHAERLATMRKGGRVIWDWDLAIPWNFPSGPTPGKWSAKSGTAALGFAFCQIQKLRRPGDTELAIDCYGVDLEGTLDSFGNKNTTRDPDRWRQESETWDAMVEIIHKTGIRVNRIRPESDSWAT